MDNRSILAIVACLAFYLAYNQYLSSKYPKQPPGETATQATGGAAPGAPASSPNTPPANAPTAATTANPTTAAAAGAVPAVHLSTADLRLESDKVVYLFSQEVGGLSSLILRDYKRDNHAGADPFDLLDGPMPLQATTDVKNMEPYVGLYNAERRGNTLKFWRDQGDLRLTQEFTVPETGFSAALKVSFTNIGTKPVDLVGGLLLRETILPKKSPTVLGIIPGTVRQRDQLVYNADGSTEWLDIEKFCKGDKDPPKVDGVPIKYAGIDRHYFMVVFQPKAKTGSLRLEHGKNSDDGCPLSVLNYDKEGTVQPGETVTLDYTTFAGPKDLSVLKTQDPALEGSLHLGVFSFIARPLLVVIEGFEKVTRNYGVAIILLTICLKLLFFPLVRASSISMHKMKKLNPQMQLIREKYKDDRQKQQQELMKFMGANKINPAKGCLPVLPQIPVFFAFYQVLQTSIQLRHAPFALWIQDLSAMDPYFVTPLLMGVAMFAQQKLTPTNGMDKTQEKILMFMPIMFTVMMLTLPAGLTLYMLTNTVVGIAQQKWLYSRLDKRETETNPKKKELG